ncbi:MAG: PEP-CTERM sorting domain-containing protein [Limisphaerales bacterium]
MKKPIGLAIAICIAAVSFPARAQIIIPCETESFVGISDGILQPDYCLYITYGVNEIASGLYQYDYELQTIEPEALTSFTIGGLTDPLDTTGMAMLDYGKTEVGASGFNSDSVGWDWGFNSQVTSDDVSFTSTVAPGYADFTANDDDMEWTSPGLIAAPVPEPSTLTLLMASAFAFCLLKDKFRAR